jgi:transporter family protein
MTWWIHTLLSVAAAATAILARIGVQGVSSALATAIRTLVVLLLAGDSCSPQGEHRGLAKLENRTLLFLTLSGFATGSSWLAYFRAL